jgi:hypothetical protein
MAFDAIGLWRPGRQPVADERDAGRRGARAPSSCTTSRSWTCAPAQITGVEALVRWNHPTRGLMRPDLFVGMAEETGHIRALTDYVLTQAIEDQARLRAAGHDVLMSVNISGRLIDDPPSPTTPSPRSPPPARACASRSPRPP